MIYNEDVIEYISPKYDKDDEVYIVSRIVKELPEKYRAVIVLHYYNSLSIIDISKTLKISTDNVKKRLERARKMVKAKLEEENVR
jgi:RNA polymerase sigma-70 factor (ECF subfamily)